ncbi:MAG TPA: RNA polymerase sigma-54 factor [Chloroflexia bacterium]|nr:RNA polymerase sigma-54 factor [Chloroflexia bacterium]
MDLSLQANQEQSLKVSPTLIVLNQLLALSSLELQQLVQQELADNPALVLVEGRPCPSCGVPSTAPLCPFCDRPTATSSKEAPTPQSSTSSAIDSPPEEFYENYASRTTSATRSEDDGEFDPMTLVAGEADRLEQLLADLAPGLRGAERDLASYLLGSLDDRGYLACTLESAAAACRVPLADAELVLRTIQRAAPTGMAARNLRECLLLQLEEIKERGDPPLVPFVEEILRDHLVELGEHKFTLIAHTLGTTYEAVAAVRDFIKAHLNPHPGNGADGRPWPSHTPTRFVAPDVIIRLRNNQFEVEVVESLRFSLRVHPLYHRLAATAAASPQGRVAPLARNGAEPSNGYHDGPAPGPMAAVSLTGMSDTDRDHIRRYVNRSRLFMSNIAQRRETMRRITNCLVEVQGDFLRNGVRQLRPLTRAQVAQYLGLHESTVSRATADKYVMLPNRHVIPFSEFFQASLSAKDRIREMIVNEPRPLTDKEIVQRLREQGVRIARRTVTKYRNQLGIMPSTFR